MLLASLFTSLQTALSAVQIDAQQPMVVEEATILETSPRSFQENVPLGEVESYTLSFTNELGDVEGTATLVEDESGSTNLYLEMTELYFQAILGLGTCEDQQLEIAAFEPPAEESEPITITYALEELLHPRLEYFLLLEATNDSYCVEL